MPTGSSSLGTIKGGPPSRRRTDSPAPSSRCSTVAANRFSTPASADARRAGQHVERRALVDDPPGVEQEEPRAQRDRLGRAVGDVEDGDRLGPLDGLEAVDQDVARRQVEGRDGLVAEEEPRPRRQRPRQADPLPLAAGERRGIAIEQVPDPA